jgi:hypothetical protein
MVGCDSWNYAGALHVIAGTMLVSVLLPFIARDHTLGFGRKPGTIGLTPRPAPPKD